MTVREQLRLAYYRSELSQAEIAERAGVHRNTVWRVLTGQNVNADALMAVAVAVGLSSVTTCTTSCESSPPAQLAR